jgi:hypothetical protein
VPSELALLIDDGRPEVRHGGRFEVASAPEVLPEGAEGGGDDGYFCPATGMLSPGHIGNRAVSV